MENRKIFQIYFSHQTQQQVSPIAIGFDNSWFPGKPRVPALENHVISRLHAEMAHEGTDRFGILSWAFEKKNKMLLADLKPSYDEDVIYPVSINNIKEMWGFAECEHPGIQRLGCMLFEKMGKKLDTVTQYEHVIYENSHLCRPHVFDHYVREWLNPVLDILLRKDDREFTRLLHEDSKYMPHKRPYNKIELFGVPYYPFHAFLCERLFSAFLHENPQYTVLGLKNS